MLEDSMQKKFSCQSESTEFIFPCADASSVLFYEQNCLNPSPKKTTVIARNFLFYAYREESPAQKNNQRRMEILRKALLLWSLFLQHGENFFRILECGQRDTSARTRTSFNVYFVPWTSNRSMNVFTTVQDQIQTLQEGQHDGPTKQLE